MSQGITTEGARLEVNTGTVLSPVWTPIIERAQMKVPKTGAVINMTSFDDAGFDSFKAGLRNIKIDASGNYVPSDTGYQKLEDMWINGSTAQFRALWRTSDPGVSPATYRGWLVNQCVVTDLSESGNVGTKADLSLALQGSGAPQVVTL